MSKRSTETVLSDEVAKAERALETAKARAETARVHAVRATDLHASAKNEVDVAASALLRARNALRAFAGEDQEAAP